MQEGQEMGNLRGSFDAMLVAVPEQWNASQLIQHKAPHCAGPRKAKPKEFPTYPFCRDMINTSCKTPVFKWIVPGKHTALFVSWIWDKKRAQKVGDEITDISHQVGGMGASSLYRLMLFWGWWSNPHHQGPCQGSKALHHQYQARGQHLHPETAQKPELERRREKHCSPFFAEHAHVWWKPVSGPDFQADWEHTSISYWNMPFFQVLATIFILHFSRPHILLNTSCQWTAPFLQQIHVALRWSAIKIMLGISWGAESASHVTIMHFTEECIFKQVHYLHG